MVIGATTVKFTRTKDQASPEYGVAITRSPGVYDVITIVSAIDGQVVPQDQVWGYEMEPHLGAFQVIDTRT